ncbi:MAG: hypothetical protein E5W81_13585 [Mesorhizobium sp.]|nr:MAG: hypothetical protein E5W70_28865 [Mesorhizobium sp.]TIX44770.1 MAG: hypothetical protein E5V36_08705 [Mesorhizobium sp.]TKB79778.1 MAG: hypothetical protein E5W81_13585 [Mesorhizobium sp.]
MQEAQQEMTSVKAAFLSFVMLSAIVLCGLGIYSADAANDHNAVDGYGVTAALR